MNTDDSLVAAGTRRFAVALVVGGLLLLAFAVMQMFLVPIAWASIMAYTTWPLHLRLRKALHGRPHLSAAIMTLALTAAVVLPLLWLLAMLRSEAEYGYAAVSQYLSQGPHQLPPFVASLPWVGEWLQGMLNELSRNPEALRGKAGVWVSQQTGDLLNVLGGVGRNAAKLGFALITVFFLFRDGETLIAQLRHVLQRAIGARVDGYIDAVGATTKAVVYGLVLSALAQGTLAGLGYWAAGLHGPVLLAVLTALVALIPWGTPLMWVPLGMWLLLTGNTAQGIGLLAWGTLAVSWIDNLLRPLVISSATHVPFLLVMFGVLGGAAAFGLIGLFVGPVILAMLVAVWKEWMGERTAPSPASPTAMRQ